MHFLALPWGENGMKWGVIASSIDIAVLSSHVPLETHR